MRVKLFSRAFLSKIGALVLLLSLFFVPLVVQSTSASFTSSATAKTSVESYTSWDPSNLSVVSEPKENVSVVTGKFGAREQISLSYTPQLTFSFREPEYISPGSDTYRVRVYNPSGGIAHQEWRQGGSPGATVSVDLSSYITSWAGNTYGFSVRNSLLNNTSSFIREDAKVHPFPSTARNHTIFTAAGVGIGGSAINITAPQGTTITNVSWPTYGSGTELGTRLRDTSTQKSWMLNRTPLRCSTYTNLTPMRYRFYHSATGTYGPYNEVRVRNCSDSGLPG